MIEVIISHSADLDGISSAALLVRKAKETGSPYLLYLRDYKDKAEVFPETITKIQGANIKIADISTNLKDIEEVVKRISVTKGKVEWTDHHETTEDILKKLERAGVNVYLDRESGSASVLVLKRYNLNDDLSKIIADAGYQSDTLNIKDEYVRDLVDLIDYYNYLEKSPPRTRLSALAVDMAYYGPEGCLTEERRELIKVYRYKKEQELQNVVKSVKLFNVKGYAFAIAYAKSLVSGTQAANRVIENVKADVYIIVKEDGGLSFRRDKESKINLVPLANIFGGGGHPYASGASLNGNVSEKDFEKISEIIYEKIKNNWTP